MIEIAKRANPSAHALLPADCPLSEDRSLVPVLLLTSPWISSAFSSPGSRFGFSRGAPGSPPTLHSAALIPRRGAHAVGTPVRVLSQRACNPPLAVNVWACLAGLISAISWQSQPHGVGRSVFLLPNLIYLGGLQIFVKAAKMAQSRDLSRVTLTPPSAAHEAATTAAPPSSSTWTAVAHTTHVRCIGEVSSASVRDMRRDQRADYSVRTTRISTAWKRSPQAPAATESGMHPL